MDVHIDAVDQTDPITMSAAEIGTVAGLPIVEYLHPSTLSLPQVHTVLGFSGGGSSGAMMAPLAEHLAARRIRLVAFDMPGHTPESLLGHATPPREQLSRASTAVRHAVSVTMIRRWKPKSSHLEVLSHSAGIADVARIVSHFGADIDRFTICGASLPGLGALLHAARASAAAGPAERFSMSKLIRSHSLPAGNATLMYGPSADREISDAALARYGCAEHFGVALAMLRPGQVLRSDWAGRQVLLIGSAGDSVVSVRGIRATEQRLRAQGAVVRSAILAGRLPHMFLSFQAGAKLVAELIAGRADIVSKTN